MKAILSRPEPRYEMLEDRLRLWDMGGVSDDKGP